MIPDILIVMLISLIPYSLIAIGISIFMEDVFSEGVVAIMVAFWPFMPITLPIYMHYKSIEDINKWLDGKVGR